MSGLFVARASHHIAWAEGDAGRTVLSVVLDQLVPWERRRKHSRAEVSPRVSCPALCRSLLRSTAAGSTFSRIDRRE